MANTVGDVNANLQNENSYDLVCLGVHNKSGTCYLSVVMQCILSMEATRRAFMNLPDPDSPLYCIPDDSMTALIHFFFLHRRRPKMSDYRRLRKPAIAEEHLIRIEKMVNRELYPPGFLEMKKREFYRRMETELPPGFDEGMGGGDAALTLQYILMKLIQEGYVKGLEEDLSGKYTTRSRYNKQIANHIMVTFFTNPATISKFVHQGEADNNTARVFSIQQLFKFAQLYPNHLSKWSFSDFLNTVTGHFQHTFTDFLHTQQFQTTVTHFPHTLIFNIGILFTLKVHIILDEFLDLSQLADSEATPTMKAKYKLVVVAEAVDRLNKGFQVNHGLSYVRASKYANDIYCDEQRSIHIPPGENLWYKVDDNKVELIPFSSVCKITGHVVLIYEQEQPSTQSRKEENQLRSRQNRKEEQQLSTHKEEQLSTQNEKEEQQLSTQRKNKKKEKRVNRGIFLLCIFLFLFCIIFSG